MNQNKIRLIGYWHSEHEPQYPDPGLFVDTTWDESERERVIQFLENGVLMGSFRGYSWCRFRCGASQNGTSAFSDGYYYWPEGLVHYIREHHVRPPLEFMRHVLLGPIIKNYDNITSLKDRDSDSVTLDFDWWFAQKGESEESVKSYKTMYDPWTQPYAVYCNGPNLLEREEKKFQIVQVDTLGSLISGYKFTLVSAKLGNFLKEEVTDISLEAVEIFRKATAEQWDNYFTITSANIYIRDDAFANKSHDVSGNKIWIGEKGGLYVSDELKEKLENAGFDDLSFSR